MARVTGGNRGLGLEVSRQLATRGYRVLLGSRDLDAGVSAAVAIGSANIRTVRLDATSDGDIEDCRAWVEREYGGLDVLVNNAAIHYDSRQNVLAADLRIARDAFETNVIGAWRVAQLAAALCVAGGMDAS